MSGTPSANPASPTVSVGRMVFIMFFGSPVGVIVYMLVGLTFDPPRGDWADALQILIVNLIMGWPIGMLPAALAALAWRFVPKPLSLWPRIGVAALVGAATAVFGMIAAMAILRVGGMTPLVGLLLAVSGATALVATAIPFSAGPKA